MKSYICVDTKIHPFYLVAEDDALVAIGFVKEDVVDIKEEETPFLKQAKHQLLEYVEGSRKHFDLEIRLEGTTFQKKVWRALMAIPYGTVATYKEVAIAVDSPKGSRAVGMACNRNEIPIVIPCHRVVGSNQKLVGYAGGLAIKEALLKHEGYVK